MLGSCALIFMFYYRISCDNEIIFERKKGYCYKRKWFDKCYPGTTKYSYETTAAILSGLTKPVPPTI